MPGDPRLKEFRALQKLDGQFAFRLREAKERRTEYRNRIDAAKAGANPDDLLRWMYWKGKAKTWKTARTMIAEAVAVGKRTR